MRARRHRPLFLIDLAVPRDIDPASHNLDDVFLYDIDDLKNVVVGNRSQREAQVVAVQSIIESEVIGWQKWQRGLDTRPVMAALSQRAEQIKESELQIALSKLAHLPAAEQEVVKRLAQSISGKILHAPLRHLRESGESGSNDVEAIRRAFALNNEDKSETEESP